ncbi:MAG: hypothetical protein LBJ81_03085 [Puniceicoccales bacterium]|jgi:hypothetical protein|nr:hypothetical protein [Puniceicoccales bacterium]
MKKNFDAPIAPPYALSPTAFLSTVNPFFENLFKHCESNQAKKNQPAQKHFIAKVT